jgi:histidinol dehydrogenase
MISLLAYPEDRDRVEALLDDLRLDPAKLALCRGNLAAVAASVTEILQAVAERGDDAIVEYSRKYDDPDFAPGDIRVSPAQMRQAHRRVRGPLLRAIRRSIEQVRQYQTHILPRPPKPLRRPGVRLGLRFAPLDSAGLFFPGGKASYPSSLIMLAVPALVAGVKNLVVCTAAGKLGTADLVLATAHELGLTNVFRGAGVAMVAAMAFGTRTVPAVDKIVGPGNAYVQMAKRLLAGSVGVDGFLGPSEVVTIADETGHPQFIASDLLAQAEHDPGSAFLLTPSRRLARSVAAAIAAQAPSLARGAAISAALRDRCAIIVTRTLGQAIELANRFAAEHVNLQTRDNAAVLAKLRHGGAVFVGPYSPIAAGDYVAGPSHCLPTNTTARFSSGISVYEFLRRVSVESYARKGLVRDAEAIVALAQAEGLDAHAASVRVRAEDGRRD